MKNLIKFLSIAGKLGIGGIWKPVVNIAVFVIIGLLLYLGFNVAWNQVTYANKHYKALSLENSELQNKNSDLKDKINRTVIALDSTKKAKTADSLEFQKRVVEFQTLIQQLQARNKAAETRIKEKETYISELESGLFCKTVKVGLFGKKTVTIGKCEEENF